MAENKQQVSYSELSGLLKDTIAYESLIKHIQDSIKKDIFNLNLPVVAPAYITKTTMNHGAMLTMLYLLKPIVDLYPVLTLEKTDILSDYSNTGSYAKLFDRYITRVYEAAKIDPNLDLEENLRKVQEAIAYSINEMSIFAADAVLFAKSPTISIHDILSTVERHPEIRELMNFSHETHTADLTNIQDKIKVQDDVVKKVIDCILSDDRSQLATLIKSGGGININQLAEVIVVIGYKPDIQGRVVSTPLNTSFFKGIDNIVDAYTNALGGRKANITSKMQVKSSGYLNRKTGVATEDIRISKDTEACESERLLEVELKTKKHLNLFVDRWYTYPGMEGFKLLTSADEHLIGSKIKLKSPITCGCERPHICKECYGELHKINHKLNIGTIATLIFTEPMSQGLLSSKHLLKVRVDVRFPDIFVQNFTISNNEVIPKDVTKRIYVKADDMRIKDEYNINKWSTRTIYLEDEKGGLYEVNSPVNLFLPDREIESLDGFYDEENELYVFSMNDFKEHEATYMFSMMIRNTGIADPLLAIKDGLDKNYLMRDIHKYRYNEYCQDLFDKVVHSGISVRAVHLETILSSMIYFEGELEEGECTFYNINDSIYHSPSPVKSLIYQQGTKQLTTDNFNNLFTKSGSSEFDRLILPELIENIEE